VLDRLGDAALACGKRVRSSTAFGRDTESMASVALRLASRVRGGLHGASVVVLGAGETAQRVLTQLESLDGARVTVISRTYERAADAAAAHRAAARPWPDLAGALVDADVVIGCTSAPTPVLEAGVLAQVRSGAGERPLLCLDLGVPRDIDPGVAALPGVTLIDVVQLDAEAAARRVERARDHERAGAIVERETERYMAWWRGRGVASTVTRLHARADAIRNAEVERALARLPGLGPHERAVIHEMASRVVGKLLHEPTVALKRDPEGANMALVLERLFALADENEVDDLAEVATERRTRDDARARPDIHQESSVS
jgi:glutamyl-tRNA reductase